MMGPARTTHTIHHQSLPLHIRSSRLEGGPYLSLKFRRMNDILRELAGTLSDSTWRLTETDSLAGEVNGQ